MLDRQIQITHEKPTMSLIREASWTRFGILMAVLASALLLLFGATMSGAAVPNTSANMVPATFADVAEKASPAVVNISSVQKAVAMKSPFPMMPGGPFDEFFKRFYGGNPPMPEGQKALGTGFIIDPQGLIITNNHVVENAEEVKVKLSDGREFVAEIKGRDPKTDLALIKISGHEPLPFLKLGNSDQVRVGDWVVAIGNPFGLSHTVTSGIISARGRVIGAGPYDDFLQTDAQINPGNSGGPLLNLAGEVVGINTAIVAGGDGIGFAIPSNLAQPVVAQLESKGRVARGWLGVSVQEVTSEMAKSFGLPEPKGALVADLAQGGPAEKAGLERGDVIVSFNDKDVHESSQLPNLVASSPIGSEARVRVLRDGNEKSIKVTLGELPEETTVASAAEHGDNMGLAVEDMNPMLAERLGVASTKGVVVTGIAPGSKAADSGLRPGDVIMEVNRHKVNDVNDFQKALREGSKDRPSLLLVQRQNATLYFTLPA